jgi:hypothetical protein
MKNQTNPKKDDRFQQVNSIILNNDKFLVAIDGNKYDSLAAGTGLFNLLKSLGKEVDLYSLENINADNYPKLKGIENFVQDLGGTNKQLEVVFNCPLENIERVTSNEEGEKLSLTINFKPGAGEISPADVEIKKPDPVYQAGFILGAELPNEQSLTSQGQWIWISRQGGKKNWADVNVVEEKATLSESVIGLVSRGDFQIPVMAANNFYLGIKKGTNNFENADSIALETAAYCLRIKEKQERKISPEKPAVSLPTSEEITGEEVEAKESTSPEGKEGAGVSEWKKPPVFTGATTPKK